MFVVRFSTWKMKYVLNCVHCHESYGDVLSGFSTWWIHRVRATTEHVLTLLEGKILLSPLHPHYSVIPYNPKNKAHVI